ncbi:MAG: glycoside hydrolase family 27 protein [Vitreoscilla sp.]
MKFSRRGLLGAGLTGIAASALPAHEASAEAVSRKDLLAPTPPMGWNSWNSFATTINEAQARETAQVMADRLLPFGYDVFTIDIQWYEANASGYGYNPTPEPAMDGYGRLIPAVNRFPSAAGGRGFAALASDVHGMGLKFGIHLMRGIPRLAVKRNLPILGTTYRAADVADTTSLCGWNPDMYGVDMSRPGAQAYYDSVFALYASWGIDFIKMDDMSRPYDAHAPEIEGAHRAIVRTGRPMALSLSPGETPVIRGEHVRQHAQMWRISDDFWDEWNLLEAQFTRLENWNPWRRPGAWPDPDMLPLGRLALGARDTKFTPDEQRTLMTLWSITRSPLIMGGDLRHLDEPTLALLTNPEVLAVDQASSDNRPHFVEDGARIWSARPDDGKGRYVALFNTSDKPREVSVALRDLGLNGTRDVRDLWTRRPLPTASGRFAQQLPPHGAGLYRLS